MKKIDKKVRNNIYQFTIMILMILLVIPVVEHFSSIAEIRLREHYSKRENVNNYINNFKIESLKKENIMEEIPDYNTALKFLNELISESRNFRIKLSAINTKKIKSKSLVRFLELEIPLTGEYSNIKRFIHSIENSKHQVFIESIENNPENSPEGKLALTLGIIVIYKEAEIEG